MSTNFTGVTFSKQRVLPSDDAIIRRAILPDGILSGCELSYSGYTLTMAAGQLLACGRQFKHPAAQNWAVADATSGYARLVLTIDLTRTATKETFDQVVDTIEYATAVDGFPALEQADINGSGVRYQIVACVVALGTGGITGIVSQLGKSAVDGAGALNFKLVGGVTQPADPSNNTIWVSMDEKISSYIFSAVEPGKPAEGMVWFLTGTSSNVAFDALKKSGIMVYPLSAKQFVGGAWVDKPAMSYQGGAWVDWLTYLFSNGNQFVDLTGGWEAVDTLGQNYAPTGGVATIGNTLRVTTVNADGDSNRYSGIATVAAVDVTRFSKLKINVTAVENGSSETVYCSFGLSADKVAHTADVAVAETGEYELDISSMSGLYYPFIQVSNDTRALEVSAVWMQ